MYTSGLLDLFVKRYTAVTPKQCDKQGSQPIELNHVQSIFMISAGLITLTVIVLFSEYSCSMMKGKGNKSTQRVHTAFNGNNRHEKVI